MSDCVTLKNNNKLIYNDKPIFKNVFFWVLIVCIECVFLKLPYWIYLGPIMAMVFAYLYFIKKETILVTFFIVIAHYELKAVLFSTISFPQLLFVFLVYELITNIKWTIKSSNLIVITLAFCMTVIPCLLGSISWTDVFYILVYIFAIFIQILKFDDKEYFIGKACQSIMVIVSLIALHAVITGGVEYTDVTDMAIIRKGILAVGIGDPNFSCFLLCVGIVSSLYCKNVFWWVRIILVLLMSAAMINTVSTTGLLGLGIIAMLYVLTSASLSSKIKNVVYILLSVVLLFQLYVALPSQYRHAGIDTYIVRMEEKYGAWVKGDYSEATTNRSNLSERYMTYINEEQSFANALFGGNPVVPKAFRSKAISHVTFIDFILQYGYFGTTIILMCALYKLKKKFDLPKDSQYRQYAISLKIVCVFFALSISIYRESCFAILFMSLFII